MLVTGLEILSMRPGDTTPVFGSLRIEDGKIVAVGKIDAREGEESIDLKGLCCLPGFVQGHIHLCQTLFRNLAEDLPLMAWLEQRIWPLEAAHDEASLRASARLALDELISGGCTLFQSMESVHGTEHVIDEVLAAGLRGIVGNSLMDVALEGMPDGLTSTTQETLERALALHSDYDAREGRVHVALCPRFLLACSRDLLDELGRLRKEHGYRIHSHACEHLEEVRRLKEQRGVASIVAFDGHGLLGPETSLAHCVHIHREEEELLQERQTSVLHCPSTNLKLGSGIAPIRRYLERGIPVAIGSDGAPANNRLDPLTELRMAALLQQYCAGPASLDARQALALLTREGARALGMDAVTGTVEVGKAADLVFMDLSDPNLGPGGDSYHKIVYAADRRHIRHVMRGGTFLMWDSKLTGSLGDRAQTKARSEEALEQVLARVVS